MKWFVMEVCPRSNPLMLALPMAGFSDLREFGAPKAIGYSLIDSRKGDEKLLFPRKPFSDAGKSTLEKLLSDPDWGRLHNEMIVSLGREFFGKTDELLAGVDFRKKTNAELADIYSKLMELQRKSHVSGLVWVVVEFDHQLLTRYLMEYLKMQIRKSGSSLRATETFSVLTTPLEDSFAQKEEISLLQITAKIKEKKLEKIFDTNDSDEAYLKLRDFDPDIAGKIDSHTASFAWLPYMYEGPAWKKTYFMAVARGLLKEDVATLLGKALARHAKTRRAQESLLSELQIDAKHRKLFDVASGMVFTKGFRKDCLYHFFWRLEPFLKETAKRLGLTLRQVRTLMPGELPTAIKTGVVDADELNRRYLHYILYIDKGKVLLLSGADADASIRGFELEENHAGQNLRELSGECACPGFAKGIVRRIEKPQDMTKMQKGDVLVAHATNPDIVPAMKMASAIITDMGGITCHAAIVSRELKIPCVIGTKVATTVLKDGEAVEVDATHGRVTKIG